MAVRPRGGWMGGVSGNATGWMGWLCAGSGIMGKVRVLLVFEKIAATCSHIYILLVLVFILVC